MDKYLPFIVIVALIAVAPGPDTFLTLRSTLLGGKARGFATIAGVTTACALQGLFTAWGFAAVLARFGPALIALKIAGVAYLLYLGAMAIRSALKDRQPARSLPGAQARTRKGLRTAMWQGFLCNITNPKILMFNLAILPQFVGGDTAVPVVLLYGLSSPLVGGLVLVAWVFAASAARQVLDKPRVQRRLDAVFGSVMLGFAGALAVEA